MPTPRPVVLIHWHPDEAAERVRAVQLPGFRLQHLLPRRAADWAAWRASPPAAVVIDLSRLPSHGREVALGLRGAKATRSWPVVFVGGAPDKVAATQARVPGAWFCDWTTLATTLDQALRAPPAATATTARSTSTPVRPAAAAGYSATPLAQKIGIKPDARVLVVGAPAELASWLAPLPDGATLVRARGAGVFPVVWLFTTHRADLERRLLALEPVLAQKGHLWVSWPKQTSGVASDLTEGVIRDFALANGLVDTKVCAVTAVWSGLRLNRRQAR